MAIAADVQLELTRIDNLVYAVQQATLALFDQMNATNEEFVRRHAGNADLQKSRLATLRTTLAAISTVAPV